MEKKLLPEFGLTVKELREERKLTQEKFAELADYTPVYISFMENGRKVPRLTTVFQLAAALNISASELIRKVEERITKNKIQELLDSVAESEKRKNS